MAPDSDDKDLRARVAELEATVEQQQATIEQLLPTRRRVLQAGGLVAGGGVLGALSADRASAQASGQVGTNSDPVDVEAFDLAVQNQLSSSVDAGGNDLTNIGSLNTERIISGRHYAGGYDGNDPDARLANALSEADSDEIIYLEVGAGASKKYTSDLTINKDVTLIGGATPDRATDVNANWTHAGVGGLRYIDISQGSITHTGGFADITGIKGSTISVQADNTLVAHCRATDVTFASGTSGGLADSLFGSSSVTDNGANTVGDIS